MITIYNKKTTSYDYDDLKEKVNVELRGLSTDEKPIKIGEQIIENGSTFIEIDTGKIYLYDLENEQWKEI